VPQCNGPRETQDVGGDNASASAVLPVPGAPIRNSVHPENLQENSVGPIDTPLHVPPLVCMI
jgi:hypothetical protein